VPGQIFSALLSSDREGVVADPFSSFSLLKMTTGSSHDSHFHGSIVSRKLLNNCVSNRVETSLWYGKSDMALTAYIVLGVLILLYAIAKGAIRFNVGPPWLRRLIIDEHKN
jgi:hypothetical protein